MPHMSANNIQLHFKVAGQGDPLVLVHGGWSDLHNWQSVVPGLAEAFTVVAVDRRGHGGSERIWATRRDQEDDLAALIETVGLGPAHVAGTSFGSAIALGLAARRPDLVRTLTAHEPALPALAAGGHAVLARIRAALARVRRGDIEGGTRQFLEDVALGEGAWERLPEAIRATMARNAPAVLEEQGDPAWGDADLRALSRLEIPVLLTQGGQSPGWFAEVVARLRAVIPRTRVHRYADAGDSPHITHPEDYVPVVTAFAASSTERAGLA
jgi:pimeloyl-ACP methyl ester carboxylesterase